MNLRSLQIFVRVHEMGSLTKAAGVLGVTQPSLSRAITSIEREFGGALFHRNGRGVSLTELGEVALPRAKALLVEAEQLTADMRDHDRAPSGVVSLGLLPSISQILAAPLFEEVRREFPGIRLRIFEGFSGQIDGWLADGYVDIGLMSRYRAARPERDDVILTSRLLLVGSADGYAFPSEVEFSELAALPLVLPASPNGLRLIVDEAARRKGVALTVVLESDSLNALKQVVRNCGAFTVLSHQAISEEVAKGLLACSAIDNPQLSRAATLSTSTQRPLSRAARDVATVMRRVLCDLIPPP